MKHFKAYGLFAAYLECDSKQMQPGVELLIMADEGRRNTTLNGAASVRRTITAPIQLHRHCLGDKSSVTIFLPSVSMLTDEPSDFFRALENISVEKSKIKKKQSF